MGFEISVALRNALLVEMKTQLDGGVIRIYDDSAAIPSSPTDAVGSAVLLCTVSNNSAGTGINFDTAPASGTLAKAPAETWSGTNAASGTAAFYRFSALSDTGAYSTTEDRLQGTIGTVNADLLLSSTTLTSGNTQRVDYYTVGMPEE